jgi:predicted RNA-binding Zn-ribbon protein involved in translation (DUF1610 family)
MSYKAFHCPKCGKLIITKKKKKVCKDCETKVKI